MSEMELREMLQANAHQISLLKQESEFRHEFDSLRQDVHLELSRLRWIATGVVALIGLLGFFGYKDWRDLRGKALDELTSKITEIRDYQYDLTKGLTLSDTNRDSEAVTYLSRCFEKDPYDEVVLKSLFASMDAYENPDAGDRYLSVLRKDQNKFNNFKDAFTYSNIAWYMFNRAAVDEKYLDEAFVLMKKALQISSQSNEFTRQWVFYNLWRYFLIKGDTTKAQENLDLALRIANPSYWKLENVIKEDWFVRFSASRPNMKAETEKMWKTALRRKASSS